MGMMLVVLIYLIILGIQDYREGSVSVMWLAAGAGILAGLGINRCIQGELLWMEVLLGIIPGAFLLAIAGLSGKAGYADGVVLIELGVCLGYREIMLLFGFSLLLLSMVSVLLLFLRKVRRNTKLPYLPFLAIVFILRQLCMESVLC